MSKTGFEKWQDGIEKAKGDPKWNVWDCEIQRIVNAYNQHLAKTPRYVSLDWKIIKAILWVETGATDSQWNKKPMQIGVAGDPGLAAFLSGNEGGDLILPPLWKGQITVSTVRTVPSHNIVAGVGYLLMRLATYEHRSVLSNDPKIYEIKVKPGDNFDKISRDQGSTIEVLKQLNPTAHVLRPGQVLKYRKASIQRVIIGWRSLSTTSIAVRYNSMTRDPNYAKKLDFSLDMIRHGETVQCVQ